MSEEEIYQQNLGKIVKKVGQLTPKYQEEIIKRDKVVYTNKNVKSQVYEKLSEFMYKQEMVDSLSKFGLQFELIRDLSDEFFNIFDSVCVL